METEKSNPMPLEPGRDRGIRKYESSVSSPEDVSVTELLDNLDPQPQSLVLAGGRGRGKLTVEQVKSPSQDVSSVEADIQVRGFTGNFIVSTSTPPPVVEAPSDGSEANGAAVILQGDGKGGGYATKAGGEFSTEQAMEQLTLTSLGSTGFEKVPVPGELANAEEPDSSAKGEGKELPRSHIEKATEFRKDAILLPEPKSVSFLYCCVCGVPAGKDARMCFSEGHSTCIECQTELDLKWCHYICLDLDEPYYCRASLQPECSSFFRDYFFDNTKFGCFNYTSGCQYQGIWKDVKIHQKSCQFTPPSATDSPQPSVNSD